MKRHPPTAWILPLLLLVWGHLRAETLRFAYDVEFAPFESVGPQGEYQGAAADILRHVGKELGLDLVPVHFDSWPDAVQAFRDGRVDLLPCVGVNPERSGYMLFTAPYLAFARVVVTRKETELQALESLPPGKIGVQRDSSHHGYLLAQPLPEPRIFDSFRESMLALATEEVDTVIGNLATVTHVMQNLSLNNLKIAERLGDDAFTLHMAVRPDRADLLPRLNRALADLSPEARNRILDVWIPLPHAADKSLELSRAEKEWLLLNPRIRVGWDPDWAPVEFVGENGLARGFSMDLLREIEGKLGIRFLLSPPTPWPETLRKLQEGRLDMVSCVGEVPGRESFLRLTDVYLSAPLLFFARKEYPYIRSPRDLKGRTLAIPKDYAEQSWFRRDHPGIRILDVATVSEGLQAVASGKADAFAGSVMQGNYYLSRLRNPPLVIAGESGYNNNLHIGVRADWELFLGILNKTLRSIPEEKTNAIYRDWVWVEYRQPVNYRLVAKVAGVGALGMLLFFSWNRRLAKEIRLRTQAERDATESRGRLEKSYRDLQDLERQRDNLTHMIVHDMRSPLTVLCAALEMEDAEMAKSGALELNRMVDALLDIGRLESGQMPLKLEELSVRDIAARSLHGLASVATGKGIALTLEGDGGLVRVDPDLVGRVFTNLVSNALRACRSGDRIALRICRAEKTLRVDVTDNGKGIDPKDHQRIFEKFTQAGEPEGGFRAEGSGIGLHFCRLAVEAHGGTIGVESEPGKGSTFWFELPAHAS